MGGRLRREHPDAEIVTEHVQIDESAAIFKATVRLPSGGMATGYGSETASDFGDFIEKAETKAIGRALNALGYGAQFGERGSEEAAEVVPPRAAEPAAPPARPAPARPVSPVKPAAASHDPSGEAPPPAAARRRAAPAPVDLAAERERVTDDQQPDRAGDVATTVAPEAAPTAGAEDGAMAETATGETGEPDLADYSWSLFWPWARGLGLNSRNTIEALTGQDLTGRSPAEVRAMILTARGER